MKSGVISVIVPVYKVEKYLRECIESIIHQTYSQLEIILVDDESPDNSGAICEEYAAKDSRIRVIHQKNGGAAAARNTGLRIASGEYLAFVDSDDYLELDAYEKMRKAMDEYGADAVQCGFREVYVDTAEERVMYTGIRQFSGQEYLAEYLKNWTCALLWDKLYRKSLFDGTFFEEGHLIDDEFFTYQGMMNARTVVYVPQIIYNYRQRASSVMNDRSGSERMLLDRIDVLSVRRKKIYERVPELRAAFDNHYIDSLLQLASADTAAETVQKEVKKRIRHYFLAERKACTDMQTVKSSIAFLLHKTEDRRLQKMRIEDKEATTHCYFE